MIRHEVHRLKEMRTIIKAQPHVLGINMEIIFLLEKFYLDLNQKGEVNHSPKSTLQEIAYKYNIPTDEFTDQIELIQMLYEEAKKDFLRDYESSQFILDFNQFFHVESPADFSLAFHLYLFAQTNHCFEDDHRIGEEELNQRKFIISQVLADDPINFKNLKSVDDIVDYLRLFPTSNHKRWMSILILHHARQITDQLLKLIDRIKELYLTDEVLEQYYKSTHFYTVQHETQISDWISNADKKEIIKIPSVTSFNALKIYDDEYSNCVYVFVGILYDDIGRMIKKYSNNDKALVSRLKSIGESNRLGILRELKKGPLCGKDIAALLNLTPATVSHHMNTLVNEGLVSIYKEGTRIDYKVNREEAKKLIERLKQVFF